MCDSDKPKGKAHCRTCGGERWHKIIHKESRRWDDDQYQIWGADSYEIIECCGCETISFRHTHSFSEDHDGQGNPVAHKDYYPPAPTRGKPDWVDNLLLSLLLDETWIYFLLKDIYVAVGLKSFSLAAMGARAIVDAIITYEARDGGRFSDKIRRLVEQGKIDAARGQTIHAAYDAGSAVAHRGHKLDESNFYALLTIMESLLFDFRVKPSRDAHEAKVAEQLRGKTPKRPDRKKP